MVEETTTTHTPKIVFKDNTATNARGVMLILNTDDMGDLYITSPSMRTECIYLPYNADDPSGHNRFKNMATRIFSLLDQCVIPNIHQTVFQAATQRKDSLSMVDWHTCSTTHCRAGWVTFLAGKAGAELEEIMAPGGAAELIYAQNGYRINGRLRFFRETNFEARMDMQLLAILEARGNSPTMDDTIIG